MNRIASAYLVALHLCLVVLLAKTDAVDRVAVRLGLREAPEDPFISSMRAIQRVQDQSVPAGAVLFIGDSHIQLLSTSSVAPLSVNFGIAGQRSDQLLVSMDGYSSMQRASAVVVAIGTNDLLKGREGLPERYRKILARIPEGTPVVLSGIPPLVHLDVSQAVEAGRKACEERPACTFIDVRQPLRGLLNADGVHLSPAGYRVWIALLKQALHDHTTVTPRAA